MDSSGKTTFSQAQLESFLKQFLDAVDQEGGIIKNHEILYATDYFKNDIDYNELMNLFQGDDGREQDVTYRSRRVFCKARRIELEEPYRLILLSKIEESDLVPDPLTGVLNRECFDSLSGLLLKEAETLNKVLGFLFIDLDEFKAVNDTWGHESGDVVLKTTAERISGIIRDDDFCFRIGGDEFVVVLTSVRDKMHSCLVARRLIHAISKPIAVHSGNHAKIGASIGIATYPADGSEVDTLTHKADEAMYRAKKLGKNNYQMHIDSDRREQ